MKRYYLGIDTSCYTTSCAIVDSDFHIVGEARKILEVKLGERGLQQSNMVFQHIKALPKLMSELPQVSISGIGVSGFPRREENSYMPAFMVGLGQGETLSHLMNVPLHIFAHQENHILAALRDLKNIPNEPFLALHLSGGTTELVYCHYQGNGIFESHIVGGSKDLQGGQYVDRIGVALGLPFPAGKHLEALALQTTEYEPLPSSVKDGWISFAGPCSAAMRRINNAMSDIDKSKLSGWKPIVNEIISNYMWRSHNSLLIMPQVMLLVLLIYKNLEDNRECINHYTIKQSHKTYLRS